MGNHSKNTRLCSVLGQLEKEEKSVLIIEVLDSH